jgi:hypothetical protein
MKRSARQISIIVAGILAVCAVVLLMNRTARAQNVVRPDGPGDFHFETKIGSFKLLGMDNGNVTGDFQMTGKGTLLISGLDVPPTITGTLKLEYSYDPLKKYCYHGQGTLVIKNGSWRNLQWFGTDLSASFHGRGKVRLVGEFDKNLNTGFWWISDPKNKEYWPPNSIGEHIIPPYEAPDTSNIKVAPIK